MVNTKRLIRLALFFVIGLLFGGVFTLSHAETINATSGTGPVTERWQDSSNGTYVATWSAAQDSMYSALSCTSWAFKNPAPASPQAGTMYTPGQCMRSGSGVYRNFSYRPYCTSGTFSGSVGAYVCTGSYTCPAGQNWTLSGSTCTRPDCANGRNADGTCKACAEGYTETGGTCKKTCTAAGGYDSNKKVIVEGSGNMPSTICYGGCDYEFGGLGLQAGARWAGEVGKSAGTSCSTSTYGSNGSAATSATPANQASETGYNCLKNGMGTGTVNGQTVCVPATSITTKSSGTGSGSTSATDAGGNTTTTTNPATTTDSTTTCTGGNCTTTTTTTTTNPDGSKSTTTGIAIKDQKSFCAENPNATICKSGSYTDGGCAAPPACDGDAVQCAQANQAWKIKCDLETEPTDEAYTLGKSIAAGGADPKGNPFDAANVTTVNVGDIVSTAAGQRTLTETCISSPSFTVMGGTFTFDVTKFCQFASIVGYMMVAASSIIAIRMVTSGV